MSADSAPMAMLKTARTACMRQSPCARKCSAARAGGREGAGRGRGRTGLRHAQLTRKSDCRLARRCRAGAALGLWGHDAQGVPAGRGAGWQGGERHATGSRGCGPPVTYVSNALTTCSCVAGELLSPHLEVSATTCGARRGACACCKRPGRGGARQEGCRGRQEQAGQTVCSIHAENGGASSPASRRWPRHPIGRWAPSRLQQQQRQRSRGAGISMRGGGAW